MNNLTDNRFGRGQVPIVDYSRMRLELREKLLDYSFSHFITLASNHQAMGYRRMRNLLREWDARVNRAINGPKWASRPDERLIWFAFPEKIEVNPHWHLIVEIDPVIEKEARAERTRRMPQIAEERWLALVPRGSFDCQPVDSEKVTEYVTKMSANETHFEKFVVSREFITFR